MRVKKRIGALALVLCLLLGMIPTGAMAATAQLSEVASGTCGDNLTWVLDDSGTLTISGTGAMTDYESDNPPWYENRDSITTVIMESGITSIGVRAFAGCGLTSVTIPNSVTAIGDCAFEDCRSLMNVTIPDSVISIGNAAFNGCRSLTSMTIPDSVTFMGDDIFGGGCSNLVSVTISNSITSIGIGTFTATALTSVTIPVSVTSIGGSAFQDCGALADVYYPGTEAQWNAITIDNYNEPLTSATIHYNSAGATTSAVVNEGTCGDNATWTFDDDGTLTIGGTGAMTDYDDASAAPWNDYRTYIKRVVVESGISNVGNHAFNGCTNLTEAAFPNVSAIGYSAFRDCASLTAVTIPDSVTSIDGDAFRGCAALEDVRLPAGVDMISDNTFWNCTGLKVIRIPDSVTSVGSYAFMNCNALTDVYYGGTQAQWDAVDIDASGNDALTNATLHVGDENGDWSGTTPAVTLDHVELDPASVTLDGTNGASVTARAIGSDNNAFTGGVTWSVTPANQGVAVDATSGAITIDASATPGEYTITATYNGVSRSATLTVERPVTITLERVELNPASVTLDGTNGATVTASAIGSDNNAFTSGVTWSVSSSTGGTGVEITDEVAGTVGISANATPGDYTITATYDNVSRSATLTVTRAAPVLTSVTLNPSSVSVYGGDVGTTSTATAYAGDTAITSGVTWSVTASIDGTGVSIDGNGVITVAPDAPSGDYTITATPDSTGTVTGDPVSVVLTVNNYTLVSVTLDPETVTLDGTSAVSVTATGHLANGDETNANMVTWSVEPADGGTTDGGVTFADPLNGTLTVAADATPGRYTVTGTLSGVSRSAVLTVEENSSAVHIIFLVAGSASGPVSGTGIDDYYEILAVDNDETKTLRIRSGAALTANGVTYTPGTGNDNAENCVILNNVNYDANDLLVSGSWVSVGELDTAMGQGISLVNSGQVRVGASDSDPVISLSGSAKVYFVDGSTISLMDAGNIVSDPNDMVYYVTDEGEISHLFIVNVASDDDILASGYCGGEGDGTNLSWVLTSDGVLTISGTGAMADYASEGYQSWASNRENITAVVIESGTTTIGNYAFAYCKLTSVSIPNSVTSIGDGAFLLCSGLTGVSIPNSVTSIGDGAFKYCSGLTSVTIPNNVTSIGGSAFYGCSGLTGVSIPDSVTSIGEEAFAGCSGLTGVSIPNSITSIGMGAFSSCSGLTSVSVPNSVTSIASSVFMSCSGLTSVTIPDSVTSIGSYAFYQCDALADVYYGGTRSQWNAVTIDNTDDGNAPLYSATIHFAGTEYTITFAPNGGTGSMDAVSVSDNSYTLPQNGFTPPEGMRFLAWLVNGTTYAPGAVISVSGDTTVTAQWEAENLFYTVTFAPNGGTGTMNPVKGMLSNYGGGGSSSSGGEMTITYYLNAAANVTPAEGGGVFLSMTPPTAQTALPQTLTSSDTTRLSRTGSAQLIGYVVFVPNNGYVLDSASIDGTGTLGSPGMVTIANGQGVTYYPFTGIASAVYDNAPSLTITGTFRPAATLGGQTREDGAARLFAPDYNCNLIQQSDTELLLLYSDSVPPTWANVHTLLGEFGILSGESTLTQSGNEYTVDNNGTTYTVTLRQTDDVDTYWLPENGFTPPEGMRFLAWLVNGTTYAPGAVISVSGDTTVTAQWETDTSDILASGYCGGEGDGTNLLWVLKTDGTLTISGSGAMADYDYIYDEDTGTDEASSPWWNYSENLLEVVIENGVSNIGRYAFALCGNLTGATIPYSVTEIGVDAFWACQSLSGFGPPASGGSVGYARIPDGVVSIGGAAFNYCNSLISVSIPASVQEIGSDAFTVCRSLTAITVASDNAFYSSENGVLFNKDKTQLLCYPIGKSETTYVIPSTVANIESSAFDGCKLTSVTMPVSVVTIQEGAFGENGGPLTDVYYGGMRAQWNAISIDNTEEGNGALYSATIHCTDGDIVNGQSVTSYVVTFEANGGTGTMNPVNVSGNSYTLPENGFIPPEGMSFRAWRIGSTDYAPGTTISVSDNTTVTAGWKYVLTSYTVTFASNGGTGTMNPVTGAGDSYTLPECGFTAPARTVFEAWSVDGTKFPPGETISVSGNVTVTALWADPYRTLDRIQDMDGYSDQTWHLAGPLSEFRTLNIDETALTRGSDPAAQSDYTATEGSTKLNIPAGTFARFGEGTHSIAADFRTTPDSTDPTDDGTRITADYYTVKVAPGSGVKIDAREITGGDGVEAAKAVRDVSYTGRFYTVPKLNDDYFRIVVVDGEVPAGLTLHEGGYFTGTPTVAGQSYTFTVGLQIRKNATDPWTIFEDGANTTVTITVEQDTAQNVETASDPGYELVERIPATVEVDTVGEIVHLTSKGPFEEFADFYIDGVKQIRDVDYTVRAILIDSETGEIIRPLAGMALAGTSIQLQKSKLSLGTHSLNLEFVKTDNIGNKQTQNASQKVTVTPKATPTPTPVSTGGSSGGGGGGGSSGPSYYSIKANKTSHGTITLSAKSVTYNQTVTVTVTPDSGYQIQSVSAVDSKKNTVTLTRNGNRYTFPMPKRAVTVSATFTPSSYAISAPTAQHGKITLNASTATPGATVNGSTTPDKGYLLSAVTVRDDAGKRVNVQTFNDGKFTFLMPSGKVTVAASFTVKRLAKFVDIQGPDWFFDDAEWAYNKGILRGTTEQYWEPQSFMSSVTSIVTLERLDGVDLTPYDTGADDGIDNSQWYASAQRWARDNNILLKDRPFGERDAMTRGECAVMLTNYLRYRGLNVTPGNDFAFTDAAEMTEDEINAFRLLQEADVFRGYGDGSIRPKTNLSRAHLSALLHRLSDYIIKVETEGV